MGVVEEMGLSSIVGGRGRLRGFCGGWGTVEGCWLWGDRGLSIVGGVVGGFVRRGGAVCDSLRGAGVAGGNGHLRRTPITLY